jgi:hypothetical protein
MRRTTLGGLTSSQLNARPSLGGSRLGALGEGGKALPPTLPRAERSFGELGASVGALGAPRASLQRRTSVYSGSGSSLRQVRRRACPALRARASRRGRGTQRPACAPTALQRTELLRAAHRAGGAARARAPRARGAKPLGSA